MAGLGSNQHTASQWSQERMNQRPVAPINKATIQQLLRWPASRQSDHDQWLLPQLLNTHTLTHSLQAQQEPCGLKLSHCRVSSLQGPTQLPMPVWPWLLQKGGWTSVLVSPEDPKGCLSTSCLPTGFPLPYPLFPLTQGSYRKARSLPVAKKGGFNTWVGVELPNVEKKKGRKERNPAGYPVTYQFHIKNTCFV